MADEAAGFHTKRLAGLLRVDGSPSSMNLFVSCSRTTSAAVLASTAPWAEVQLLGLDVSIAHSPTPRHQSAAKAV